MRVIPDEAVEANVKQGAMSHLIEHPDHPGFFYDPGLVYIRTGDAAKDAAHRLMMAEHSYCFPQTAVIGVEPPRG